jgi:hypothetical protein
MSNCGNAASRVQSHVQEFIRSNGGYAYGGYPDIDDNLFQQPARERDPKKREALLPIPVMIWRGTGTAATGGGVGLAPPGGRAQWDPRVPSAARRAAFGRAGDGAGRPGGGPDDRTSRRCARARSLQIMTGYLEDPAAHDRSRHVRAGHGPPGPDGRGPAGGRAQHHFGLDEPFLAYEDIEIKEQGPGAPAWSRQVPAWPGALAAVRAEALDKHPMLSAESGHAAHSHPCGRTP